VAVLSAVAAAATSWGEFSDMDRKLARYTNAIRAIKNLHTWWLSLGQVEKASAANISKLVLTGEAIIVGESQAWQSMGAASSSSEETMKKSNQVAPEPKRVNKPNQVAPVHPDKTRAP